MNNVSDTHTHTDCRTEVGITVGLIDTIINCARLLSTRDLSIPAIKEALLDLREDQDVANLFSCVMKEDINE
jgi:hypothetical protein